MDLDCQEHLVRDRREQVIVLQKRACGSPWSKAERVFKVIERVSLLIILSFKARECHDRIHSLEELLPLPGTWCSPEVRPAPRGWV